MLPKNRPFILPVRRREKTPGVLMEAGEVRGSGRKPPSCKESLVSIDAAQGRDFQCFYGFRRIREIPS